MNEVFHGPGQLRWLPKQSSQVYHFFAGPIAS